MPVLNANKRTGSLKLHNWYFIARACICTKQSHHCTEWNHLFLFHFLNTHTLYQHSVTSAYWWIRTERKRNCGLSIFSFCVVIFKVSCWLLQGTNMSKQWYNRVPWLFLGMPLPFFWVASSGSNGKCASQGCQGPGLITFRCNAHSWSLLWELLNSGSSWDCRSLELRGDSRTGQQGTVNKL